MATTLLVDGSAYGSPHEPALWRSLCRRRRVAQENAEIRHGLVRTNRGRGTLGGDAAATAQATSWLVCRSRWVSRLLDGSASTDILARVFITLKLDDDEAADVRDAAARAGKSVQTFVHDAVIGAARGDKRHRDELLASVVEEDAVALERLARERY
jgi:uncharacterized protein (DUF1778 family)